MTKINMTDQYTSNNPEISLEIMRDQITVLDHELTYAQETLETQQVRVKELEGNNSALYNRVLELEAELEELSAREREARHKVVARNGELHAQLAEANAKLEELTKPKLLKTVRHYKEHGGSEYTATTWEE